jgi:AraC-like DNA-binding protein
LTRLLAIEKLFFGKIDEVRKKGAELLSEGQYKINEVAYMIGYSLPTNFSRDFQKQFGISPSNFVNQLST